MAITNKYSYVYEDNPEYSDLYVDSFIKALSSSSLPQDTFDSIIASTFGKPAAAPVTTPAAAAPVTTPAATQITTPVTNTTTGGITDLVAAPTTNTTTANTNTAVTTPVVTTPVTTTGGIADLVSAPVTNTAAKAVDPYSLINDAWNSGDYAATNAIIASSGLTAKDIQSHYGLDDNTMNWVLSQGIKTADQAQPVDTSVTKSTTTASANTAATDTTAANTSNTVANWPTIIYGSTDEDGRPLTQTTTSDGTPFYIHDTDEGGYYQNPNTVESYAPFTGADGKTYYNVYAPTFSSGLEWNQTPITGVLTEAQYRALKGGDSAIGNLINSPVGSFALGLLGPYGQAINAANQASQGNYTGALLSGVNAAGGFGATNIAGLDIGTAKNVAAGINAIDKKNLAGALTAGANLLGTNTGDFKTAGSLVSASLALKNDDAAGFMNAIGDLTNSSDIKLAAAAAKLKAAFESGNPASIQNAFGGFSSAVSPSGATSGTGSTTVGNFEDTEVTRLKGLGYTNQQIQDYFNRLENTTDALDTAVTGTTTAGLPTGVQLASLGDGVFRTNVGGVPTYAESANASSVTAPFGYSLLSTAEADNKPTGSYYDPTANAWFKPDTGVTDLLGSTDIQSDLDLFTNSVGDLDQIASTTATTTDDTTADFLASIGITNTDQLTDSGLSNQDILDIINAADDTVTVTGSKGNDTVSGTDTITGGTGNDNIDTVTVTGAKGNDTITGIDTITGGDGNDLVIDDKGEVVIKDKKEFCPVGTVLNPETGECDVVEDQGEVVIKDKKESCPIGTVLNPETGDCDPIDETLTCPPGKVLNDAGTACIDEVVIKDKKDFCPVGTVLNTETGECDPIVATKEELTCPTGYEPNEAGTACIPVVTITDKKCQPGYVYDEDLQMCVPETKTPLTCPTGFHLSDDGLSCVADTKETLKCPVGYELNDAGTECIPVVEIKDKKCQPGYVYDEDLMQCVPIKDDTCPTGFHKDATGKCVPDETKLNCPEGYEPNEAGTACIPVIEIKDKKCGPGFVYDEALQKCVAIETQECAKGFHRDDVTGLCVPDEEKTLNCPEGYEPNEAGTACIPVVEIKDKKCGPGFVYDEDLKQCVPIKEDTCPTGFHKDESGKCVPNTTELKCPEGYELNEAGTACIPVIKITDKKCQPGYVYDEDLQKCVPIEEGCAPGFHEENGICVPDDDEECKAGYEKVDGVCVPVCKEGYIRNLATGICEKVEDKACPPGQVKNVEGKCVPIVKPPPPKTCPTGYVLVGDACVPIPKTLTATPSTSGLSASGEKTEPIYAGGMDSFNLLATLEQLLAETDAKKDTKETKQKTKMATGGHLDDLLAEQMTVDDLLKLLR